MNNIYGQPQVASPRTLRSLQAATERREQLDHTESRAITAATERADITTTEGSGHIPGYTGHIPGHDDNLDSTRRPFGRATQPSKLAETRSKHGMVLGRCVPA